MKVISFAFLSFILLFIPETSGQSYKPNVTFKDWSAKIGQTGSLIDVNVSKENVIVFSPFIIACPIDEKSGQRKRMFEFLKKRELGIREN